MAMGKCTALAALLGVSSVLAQVPTSAPAPPPPICYYLPVCGVDFAKLQANPDMKNKAEEAVKETMALADGISKDDVTVTLSAETPNVGRDVPGCDGIIARGCVEVQNDTQKAIDVAALAKVEDGFSAAFVNSVKQIPDIDQVADADAPGIVPAGAGPPGGRDQGGGQEEWESSPPSNQAAWQEGSQRAREDILGRWIAVPKWMETGAPSTAGTMATAALLAVTSLTVGMVWGRFQGTNRPQQVVLLPRAPDAEPRE